MQNKQYIQPATEVTNLIMEYNVLSESNPFEYGGGGNQTI